LKLCKSAWKKKKWNEVTSSISNFIEVIEKSRQISCLIDKSLILLFKLHSISTRSFTRVPVTVVDFLYQNFWLRSPENVKISDISKYTSSEEKVFNADTLYPIQTDYIDTSSFHGLLWGIHKSKYLNVRILWPNWKGSENHYKGMHSSGRLIL
jgi:hypothetical protein